MIPWNGAKTVKNKVCKVINSVTKTEGRRRYSYTHHTYDVQWLDGRVEKNIGHEKYCTFDEWKRRLDEGIEQQNKILNMQYKKRAAADELEKKANAEFKVGE